MRPLAGQVIHPHRMLIQGRFKGLPALVVTQVSQHGLETVIGEIDALDRLSGRDPEEPRSQSRFATQGSTCTMRWSPRDKMELSQMVLTQPRLRPVQLPWVGKWLSNNVGRPIRCICSISSGMSSTRSVMILHISFIRTA